MGSSERRYLTRAIKCIISLGFYCAWEASRALARVLGLQLPAVATVIYYHRILPHERRRFADQLDHLCNWVKPIPAGSRSPLVPGLRYAAVTFDDGWVSFAANALPELEQRGIPVTVFVVAGFLGHQLEEGIDEELISEGQLAQLAARGVTVGSHTLTHAPLTKVDRETAVHELIESRARLSKIINEDVELFSFPFSLSDKRLLPLCRDAGYTRVFTGLPRLAYSQIREFETGRIRVDPDDWPIEFHLKLVGAYRWLPAAFALKRRLRTELRRVSRLLA
jgi:peptidoglycan/xylan/chitin deacetylase (PgdA/CDA1 family)